MNDHLWGIDLGGTKIELVVLDASNFNVLERTRVPTDADQGYDKIVENIIKLIDDTESKLKLNCNKIGIGTPGTLDIKTKVIKNSNTECINGRAFVSDLEEKSGKAFRIANDANCFAIAETLMGAVAELDANPESVFGVIMGTGVGGGILVNGKLLNGCHGISGEWGHNYLDNSGGQCYCGKVGCVETIIAGPSLEKYYYHRSGEKKKLKTIVALAKAKEDKYATETVDRLVHYFGKAIATLVNILDPQYIVLGGGVGNVENLYSEGIRAIDKYIFNDRFEGKILRPKLGDSAGVFGAALLWHKD